MNKDADKTKEQLLAELAELRKKSKKQAEEYLRKREIELKYQLEVEKLTNKISISIANAANEKIDEAISSSLEDLAQFVGSNRSTLFSFSSDTKYITNTHEWCLNPSDSQINLLQNIPFESFGWHRDQLLNKGKSIISRVSDYPPEAKNELEWIKEHGHRSLLFITLYLREKPVGAIGFYGPKGEEVDWPTQFINMLYTVGNVILNAIERRRTEENLKAREQEQRTVNQRLQAAEKQLQGANQKLTTNNQQLIAIEKSLRESEEFLNITGEIAQIGGWEINLKTNTLKWTKEVYNIHEVEDTFIPTVEKAINFYDEQSIPVIEKAVNESIVSGKPFDVQLGIITAKGTPKNVRAQGEIKKDIAGNVEFVYGTFLDITALKENEQKIIKAKQKAEESEAKFKSYIQNAPDGIFIANEKGKYIEVNKAACEITGYSEDELLKLTIPDLIQEEYSKKAMNHFQTLAKEGFASGEMGYVTKSGEKRFWSVDAVKLSETRFLGFAKDITNRLSAEQAGKQMEEELKNSEDLLNETAMIAKVGGWKINLIGETLAWTNETFRIHELERTQQPNVSEAINYYHPDDRSMVGEAVQKTIETGEPFDFEARLITALGNQKWVRAMGNSVVNNGKATTIQGIIQDITGRKQAEEAMKESEEKLSTLFGSMTEMVVLHDLVFNEKGEPVNYRITDCNNAFTAVTGITKESAIGRLATEVYGTEDAPYLDVYSKVAINRKPYEYTTYFAPMDKHFSISVVSPKQNQFATITTDITAIKQIQKVISDKNKELENYLYVASHDLRTPLVNVQGFSNRLQKQVDSIKTLINECALAPEAEEKVASIIEESIPKTLDFIFTNVKKMDTLLNALLEISRTGRVKMTIKKIDIKQLIEKIISSMNFQITESSAKVIINQMSDCYGDENLLNQLFTNILTNAIKYRNKEEPLIIEISSETRYNKVIYKFKDNGIGIEKRHLDKIWDVFFRVGSVSSEAGDGIGLSLAKRIVDKHKGKIWVESEESKGSVFSIELLTNEFSE